MNGIEIRNAPNLGRNAPNLGDLFINRGMYERLVFKHKIQERAIIRLGS